MDDIKIFSKNENELEIFIWMIRIYNQYIGMEFGIEKYAMLIMKKGKRETTKGIEFHNASKRLEKKYLGILEV